MPAASVAETLRLTEAPQRAIAAERIRTLLAERERMSARLQRCRTIRRVWPSDANFLLVECTDAGQVLAAGRSVGLLVRDFSRVPRLAGCLRFSIGTPEQNERLLGALEAL
jgi:histidinol-phosphate/aromatic aminotransferase/cobyric acid decarboxylase-like protein